MSGLRVPENVVSKDVCQINDFNGRTPLFSSDKQHICAVFLTFTTCYKTLGLLSACDASVMLSKNRNLRNQVIYVYTTSVSLNGHILATM